jgi:hypothetical protein
MASKGHDYVPEYIPESSKAHQQINQNLKVKPNNVRYLIIFIKLLISTKPSYSTAGTSVSVSSLSSVGLQSLEQRRCSDTNLFYFQMPNNLVSTVTDAYE